MKGYERVALTKDRLKEAMQRTGKKQADLVRETGLNRGTISRYLSGAVEPRQDAAYKLALALNVSETWLWGYDVPMERSTAQKKNDDLVKIIAQMRKDPKFFNIVSMLAELPTDQYDSLTTIISALGKK
jgi:transcriptional regulator with XRE-family HTH domain